MARLTEEQEQDLAAFVAVMRAKLLENADREGWDDCSIRWLIGRVFQELTELDHAVERTRVEDMYNRIDTHDLPARYDAVSREAGDIANFAMFISSNARRRAAALRRDLDARQPGDLQQVEATICNDCLDGLGEEGHSPGCIFWIHPPPAPADQGTTLRELLQDRGTVTPLTVADDVKA